MTTPTPDAICERDASGETVLGMRVAAYRETHPEHGSKFGHIYSEHWSTPNYRHPNVKVERLFTERQVRDLIQQQRVTIERLSAALEGLADAATVVSDGLNARIDFAFEVAAEDVPVFVGIADLNDALHEARTALGKDAKE